MPINESISFFPSESYYKLQQQHELEKQDWHSSTHHHLVHSSFCWHYSSKFFNQVSFEKYSSIGMCIDWLLRVFDKVIGCLVHGIRPFYVLLSLSKALMASLRESLLKLNSADELTKLMLMVSKQSFSGGYNVT